MCPSDTRSIVFRTLLLSESYIVGGCVGPGSTGQVCLSRPLGLDRRDESESWGLAHHRELVAAGGRLAVTRVQGSPVRPMDTGEGRATYVASELGGVPTAAFLIVPVIRVSRL